MPTTGTPPKMRSSYYSEVDIKKYQVSVSVCVCTHTHAGG